MPLPGHVDLGNRLESAKSATASQNDLQTFTVELAKLTKALSDATGSLPSYDQRQCELVNILLYLTVNKKITHYYYRDTAIENP